eukprot:scaffold12435_cov69-Phaeocystis_antarctica.AAC.6
MECVGSAAADSLPPRGVRGSVVGREVGQPARKHQAGDAALCSLPCEGSDRPRPMLDPESLLPSEVRMRAHIREWQSTKRLVLVRPAAPNRPRERLGLLLLQPPHFHIRNGAARHSCEHRMPMLEGVVERTLAVIVFSHEGERRPDEHGSQLGLWKRLLGRVGPAPEQLERFFFAVLRGEVDGSRGRVVGLPHAHAYVEKCLHQLDVARRRRLAQQRPRPGRDARHLAARDRCRRVLALAAALAHRDAEEGLRWVDETQAAPVQLTRRAV